MYHRQTYQVLYAVDTVGVCILYTAFHCAESTVCILYIIVPLLSRHATLLARQKRLRGRQQFTLKITTLKTI